VGSLGLEPTSAESFEVLDEVRNLVVDHFADAGLGDLIGLAFDEGFAVVEESPGRLRAM